MLSTISSALCLQFFSWVTGPTKDKSMVLATEDIAVELAAEDIGVVWTTEDCEVKSAVKILV